MNQRPVQDGCEAARERMHRLLDGGPVDAAVRVELDRHVEVCASCAGVWNDLRELQDGLRSLPVAPMPEGALAEVLARTREIEPEPAGRGFARAWRAAAAAALLAAGLWGLWGVRTPSPQTYTVAQQEEAADEARLALKIVADALGRAQQVGMGVLSEDVAPALKKVPMKLPPATPKDSQT